MEGFFAVCFGLTVCGALALIKPASLRAAGGAVILLTGLMVAWQLLR